MIKGTVIAVENDIVLIDVGLKSEGRVPLKEFAPPGKPAEIKPGDTVEVYLERMEDKNGEAQISREKARREEAWTQLEKSFPGERARHRHDLRPGQGRLHRRSQRRRRLPAGQPGRYPPGARHHARCWARRSRSRSSRWTARAATSSSRAAPCSRRAAPRRARSWSPASRKGQILNGVVKNITDYGAFVDLGGVDGLLHVTDIAWRRINHPSEALHIGQTVKVQVIRFNPETQRISLGMKQLEADPWEGVELKYPAGARFKGRVTNITDYGAFVELEPGVEGLVHVSEMSWTKKNVHPGKIVSTSQEVEVMVLDVDPQKRRISLGLKQTLANPWEAFVEKYPVGTEVEGEVRNITEFGLFVGLPGDIDGMVHLSDIDWRSRARRRSTTTRRATWCKARVLDVDVEKERISLGIKQLGSRSVRDRPRRCKKGDVVTATVTAVRRRRHRGDGRRRPPRLHPQGRAVARPRRAASRPLRRRREGRRQGHSLDRATRRLTLSIKSREVEEEKKAMAEFGSSDSGASLGDILGAAMNRARRRRTPKQQGGAEEES